MFNITFTPREFQQKISQTCAKNNCLVVLPTGLGKTKIAIQALVNRLNTHQNSKILFLTVTKPLATQIQKEIQKSTTIPDNQVILFTGEVKPEKRAELWDQSRVVVSTPQCIENDMINKNIDITDISLLILDEAHHAIRNYSYNWIAKNYDKQAQYPRIIGLTASPGSDAKTIRQICENIYATEIEIRSKYDEDVKQYTQETEISWIMVDLPEKFKEIRILLEESLKVRINLLKSRGLIGPRQDMVGKKQLILLQFAIQKKLSSGQKDIRLWQGISKTAEALKIHHALELLETQGIPQLVKYLKGLYEKAKETKVKAVKNLIQDQNIKTALIKAEKILENNEPLEPKIKELKNIIKTKFLPGQKAIVFTHYRDTASRIKDILNKISGIKAEIFVGQMKKDGIGLSQKEQAQLIKEFESGTYNILIATMVAEQGLDIPSVDLVIFHEPIPSAIRTIQRRGRTGRQAPGEIIILITKDTRDEAYHWTALNKEKRMYRELDKLKQSIKLEPQNRLTNFTNKVTNNQQITQTNQKPGHDQHELQDTSQSTNTNPTTQTTEPPNTNYSNPSNCQVQAKTCLTQSYTSKKDCFTNNQKSPSSTNKSSTNKNLPNAIQPFKTTITQIPVTRETQSNPSKRILPSHPHETPSYFNKNKKIAEQFYNNLTDKLLIIADHREKNSRVIKELLNLGVEIKIEQLESADYILSNNVAVELKTKSDFVNSIIDGRLLSQLKPLRENFPVPILILEGNEDIYSLRNIHPNAIRGMLSTIAISYNIPILHTKNSKDTAELLKVMAEREQNPKNKDFPIRPEKKPLSLKEQQQYIIEGLPGIGPTLAKSLLKNLKTIKNIINAEPEHLQKVDKIGPKKAGEIKKVLESGYEE
ncbi:MAG: DEAD/DEAH box helicase [Nanoarchaeota archaeon]|nr:DEAD/DEAH box helicase [Nanoarchaeota archaeon]